jgi:hypothetical protein
MTFIEVLLLIDERGEQIVSDKTHAIQTDKFLYSRESNGEWIQKELPVVTMKVDPFPPLETVVPQLPKTKKKK